MVPVYLDQLTTHAARIARENVEPLICALFEIHDEIDLEKDAESGFHAIADTSLRYHWLIRRLTDGRFSIDERSALYLIGTETAAIGWMVDFVSSAISHLTPRENRPVREENCLTNEATIGPLKSRAFESISNAAADGSLLLHNDLSYILYRWRDFADNDPTDVRAWTDTLMDDDEAVVILARQFTGQSWSMGMGLDGLGDRISMPTTRAQVDDDIDILDPGAFHVALERIRDESELSEESVEIVRSFLEAWDRRLAGNDD